MEIENVIVGPLDNNCYLVTKNAKTIIIDPGDEASKIIAACQNKNVVGVIVTHHHPDHIGALKEIENYFHIKESIQVPGFDYQVLKTPGHTSDSICFYFPDEKVLFSGDFIFFHTIGRTDLPTGSDEEMKKSLAFIKNYPDDIKVYPGHGASTILGVEKQTFKHYLD